MPFPAITPLPNPPQRDGSQTPAEFSDATDQWLTSQNGMVVELNNFGQYLDDTAADISADEAAAAASAAAAAASALTASNAATAASFKGTWSSLSGSLSKPASVLHNNTYWTLLNNLANVATSEPGVTADWAIIAAQVWTTAVSSSGPIRQNSYTLATASGADITLTPPAFVAGGFIAVNNSPQSTHDVKIAVPSGMTIHGRGGSATDVDTIVLEPGDTVHIAADSPTTGRLV